MPETNSYEMDISPEEMTAIWTIAGVLQATTMAGMSSLAVFKAAVQSYLYVRRAAEAALAKEPIVISNTAHVASELKIERTQGGGLHLSYAKQTS